MHVIQTRGLTRVYGDRRVVDGFDMHVAEGDIYGFVGKNGAGKSTVMKMIDGLVAPTSGEIILFGAAVGSGGEEPGSGAESARQLRRIGVLIESPGLLPNMSAKDNLMVKALALGIVDAQARVREVLRLVGLQGVGAQRTKRFSQGMKQRLGIGLAILGNPDLLLLDEPFNGLDPEGTRDMRTLLVRLNATLGITMVISSHVLEQLDRIATRYGVIANGRMVREMSASDVQQECGDSLLIRTSDPSRTLVQLERAFPEAALAALPDGALRMAGASDAGAVAAMLHASDETVLEFSELKRDIEEYFVELMEGGASHVQSAQV